jgi:4a-hydroxytetrahydrobiopterin dehydratase
MDLTSMQCTADQDRLLPLTRREIAELIDEIPEWNLSGGRLSRRFSRNDFMDCLAFLGEIAGLAAEERHYPDVCIREHHYVDVLLYSHHAGGLTLNDFIMAAKLTAMEFTRRVASLSSKK